MSCCNRFSKDYISSLLVGAPGADGQDAIVRDWQSFASAFELASRTLSVSGSSSNSSAGSVTEAVLLELDRALMIRLKASFPAFSATACNGVFIQMAPSASGGDIEAVIAAPSMPSGAPKQPKSTGIWLTRVIGSTSASELFYAQFLYTNPSNYGLYLTPSQGSGINFTGLTFDTSFEIGFYA